MRCTPAWPSRTTSLSASITRTVRPQPAAHIGHTLGFQVACPGVMSSSDIETEIVLLNPIDVPTQARVTVSSASGMIVEDWVGDRYVESNRHTAELTGLDLAKYGWKVS